MFIFRKVQTVLGWFGRIWCYIYRWVITFGSVSRLPLPWRKVGGNEPERSYGTEEPVRRFSCDVEGPVREAAGETEAPSCVPEIRSEVNNDCQVETTDEFYCCYDSTWETEPSQDMSTSRRTTRSAGSRFYKFNRFQNAAKDMQNYRHNYPNKSRVQRWGGQTFDMPNLSFYIGETCSLPDGVHISVFHEQWRGNYDALESVHTFIQWLFPLQEPGMNYEASTLTQEEIEAFIKNDIAKKNLLESYKLMLDFYGIEMYDEETGAVQRAKNWKERFDNLNSRTHNNLRITRILKCLGTLGYRHYQAPLVHFFLRETLVNGELPLVKDSVLNYFVFAVLDKKKRRELIEFAFLNYNPKEEFVWCPKKIQTLWARPHAPQHY
ncbi:opioid growth factor receptor-like [Odontesthes bonariensis]|uniref:opioid growth factor receptor-like n=1 Tax=Odontesthes bonariensis TaxID=219752 RepID=UPI003F58F39D